MWIAIIYNLQFFHIGEIWDLMYRRNLRISNTVADKYWTAFKWPNVIREHFNYCKARLQDAYSRIELQIQIDSDYVHQSFDAYVSDVASLDIDDIQRTEDMFTRVTFLRQRLDKVAKLADEVQKRCDHLCIDKPFSFQEFRNLLTDFSNFELLWTTAKESRDNFSIWTSSFFVDIDASSVVEKVLEWSKTLDRLSDIFDDSFTCSQVLSGIKVSLDDFSRNINIITGLRNPALRDRHWDHIAKVVGLSLHEFSSLHLRQVMDLDLEMVQDILLDISNRATMEYQVEAKLDAMKQEIASKHFILAADDSVEYITNVSYALELMEDFVIASKALLKSPDASLLLPRILQWIKKVSQAAEMLESIVELQTLHRILYPVFALHGSSVPTESAAFRTVTRFLNTLTEIIKKNSKFIILILRNDLQDGIKSTLSRLESCKYQLSSLIQTKREALPRFYFLSDVDILNIIASKGNVAILNKYISKCFSGVKSLTFQKVERVDNNTKGKVSFLASKIVRRESSVGTKKRWSALKVATLLHKPRAGTFYRGSVSGEADAPQQPTAGKADVVTHVTNLDTLLNQLDENCAIHVSGIQGLYGESLSLLNSIPLANEIEIWLPQLEKALRAKISQSVRHGASSPNFSCQKSLSDTSLQICSLILEINWTSSLQECDFQVSSVNNLRNDCRSRMDSLVKFLDSYKPPYMNRAIEYLVSAINNQLLQLDLAKTSNPEQIYFLKHRIEESGAIIVNFLYSSFNYGFEYIGMEPRLLVNPQTYHSFSAIMQNTSLSQYIALVGPPGGSKLEIVKELARILGYKALVFEVNGYLSLKGFSDILEGCLLTETWLCLKNIDKLSLNLSSVVSEHLSMIQKISAGNKREATETIHINGRLLNMGGKLLQPVFATISCAGTRGWMEVSETVRTLFRPVAIRGPDFYIQVYLSLCSKGFQECYILAKKLNTFMLTFGSALSLNRHGLAKNIMSRIIELAGNYRLDGSHTNLKGEQTILCKAITKTLSPGMSTSDLTVMRDVQKAVFSDTFSQESVNVKTHWLRSTASEMGLAFTEPFVKKVEALFDILLNRRTVVVVGDPLSGKSSIIELLRRALEGIRKSESTQLNAYPCYYNSMEFDTAIGKVENGKWDPGVILRLLSFADKEASRMALKRTKNSTPIYPDLGYSWILLNGDLESSTCDGLINVSEAPESFKWLNRQEYSISKYVKLIFETDDLSKASPSFVTQNCIIYAGSHLDACAIYKRLIMTSLPTYMIEHHEYLNSLFSFILEPCLTFGLENFPLNVFGSDKLVISKFAKMLAAGINEFGSENYERLIYSEQIIFILAQYLLYIIWSIGSALDSGQRATFSMYFRKHILEWAVEELETPLGLDKGLFRCVADMPTAGTVFDYFFEIKLFRWRQFITLQAQDSIIPAVEFGQSQDLYVTSNITVLSYFSRLLLKAGNHLLLQGAPGIGKTSTVRACLRRENFPEYDSPLHISLNRELSSQSLQLKLCTMIDKRVKAKSAALKLILFVDDLGHISSNPNEANRIISLLKMWTELGCQHEKNTQNQLLSLGEPPIAMALETLYGLAARDLRAIYRISFCFLLEMNEETELRDMTLEKLKNAFDVM